MKKKSLLLYIAGSILVLLLLLIFLKRTDNLPYTEVLLTNTTVIGKVISAL